MKKINKKYSESCSDVDRRIQRKFFAHVFSGIRRAQFFRCVSVVLLCAMLAGCALPGGSGEQEKEQSGDAKAQVSAESGKGGTKEKAGEAVTADTISDSAAGASTAGSGAAEFTEPQEPELTQEEKTEKMIREYIQTLSLEDKVSGLFIITPEALTGYGQVTEADEKVRECLEAYPVAGLVYFAQNITSREQVQQMLAATREWGSARMGAEGDDTQDSQPAADTAEAAETAEPAADTAEAAETAEPAADTAEAAEAAEPAADTAEAAEPGTGIDETADAAENADAADTAATAAAAGEEETEGTLVPLFLAVDEEGGIVARIGNSAIDVPYVGSMGSVGATGDPEAAYEAGSTIGAYLQELGFNLDLAPDADLLVDPGNVTIGERSFGSDPQLCGQMVHRYVDGLHEYGIASCIKHFPGLGDTESDTHTGAAWSSRTIEDYRNTEFISFGGGIDAGTEMVMISHLSNTELSGSDLPASLNKTIITDILRGELGYEGIVITDSLRMGAVTERFGSAEAAVTALDAGVDILLMSSDFFSARQGIIDAVNDGRISEERIDESLFRILCARAALADPQ